MDYDGGHHGVGGRRVVSMGKSSGVALARLGRSLGARSTRNTGKWRLVSALRVRRHSALVALVARLPKLDPLLADLSLNLSPPDLRLWARASKDFLGP